MDTENAMAVASFAFTTIGAVNDKVRAAIESRDSNYAVTSLQEIINKLIEEREEAIRQNNELKEKVAELNTTINNFTLDESKFEHITNTILPFIREHGNIEDSEQIEMIEKLISADTLEILQILGFNYKDAVGKPLTDLCNNLVSSLQKPNYNSEEGIRLQQIHAERDIAYIRISENEEAYKRLMKLYGRE